VSERKYRAMMLLITLASLIVAIVTLLKAI